MGGDDGESDVGDLIDPRCWNNPGWLNAMQKKKREIRIAQWMEHAGLISKNILELTSLVAQSRRRLEDDS